MDVVRVADPLQKEDCMKLPKPGTKIEDLKCEKCQKTLSQVQKDGCSDVACPQKPQSV